MTHPTRNIESVTLEQTLDIKVDPQDAYLASTCPQAVQLDILRPPGRVAPTEFVSMLGEEGSEYEEEVFELLSSEVPGAELLPRHLDRELREELTIECMKSGVPLILGGRLPTDAEGHRVGEPDVLVRVSDDPGPAGRWRYRAVEVKNHLVQGRTGEDTDNLASVLMLAPGPMEHGSASGESSDGGDDSEEPAIRFHTRDLFQLAHYQRMLEECGHSAADGRFGGVIGKELKLVWYDLDAPFGEAIPLEDGRVERLSVLETYSLQFMSQLAVIDTTNAHKENPSIDLLAEPVLISDCPTCGWRDFCMEKLEEAADLSLLRGISLKKRLVHHERGVTDLHELARLDYRTAKLIKEKVDLAELLDLASDVDGSTPIAEMIPRKRSKIGKLEKEGFVTAADLSRLDERTLRYADSGMRDLCDQIDRAKARVGPDAAYRLRGVDSLIVPRADVEIDVDMECINDGVYLWGALITERDGGGVQHSEYKPFVSWDPAIEVGELRAFKEFWDWLSALRAECAESGRTIRAYCFSKGAENGKMKRLGLELGLQEQVLEFIGSEQWVDLFEVIRKQLVTGHSMGLKEVAPLAGFRWRYEESGGTQAIVRYQEASADYDSLVRDDARKWLLDYNEDDVRATAALREWLDGGARQLLSVADLGFDKSDEGPVLYLQGSFPSF
jgi:predicted RecB family nuclease